MVLNKDIGKTTQQGNTNGSRGKHKMVLAGEALSRDAGAPLLLSAGLPQVALPPVSLPLPQPGTFPAATKSLPQL